MLERLKQFQADVKLVDSIHGLNELLRTALGHYGIDHFVGACIYGPREIPDRTPMFGTMESDWMCHYVANRYYVDDVIMHKGPRADRPVNWSEIIASSTLDKIQRRIVSEAWDGGMKDGIVVPLRVSKEELAVVSMAGPDFEPRKDIQDELRLICTLAHNKARALLVGHHQPTVELSPAHWKVVTWLAEGKSAPDVASILNKSPATINNQIAEIKRIMNYEGTQGGLLMKLRRQGLIQ